MEALENQKSEVEAQADSINSQLVSLLVSYKALQQDIENQQVRIGEVGQDLAVAQENEQKQYEDMKLRIKYMYENGDASFAEAILTATSYSDLVNKSEYVEKVHGYFPLSGMPVPPCRTRGMLLVALWMRSRASKSRPFQFAG